MSQVGPELSVPSHVPLERVIDFDIYRDVGLLTDPYGRCVELLATAPEFFWTPRNGGHWVACGHRAIAEVYRNSDLFSTCSFGIPPPPVLPSKPMFIPSQLDPPEHGPYRALVNDLLGPKAVAQLEGQIRTLCIELIERVQPDRCCDFVAAVALPLPVLIFVRQMGLPQDRYASLARLASTYTNGETLEARQSALNEILDFLDRLLLDRERDPKNDWISRLLITKLNGERLDRNEIVLPMCATLFFGGLDTVKNALGHFMLVLAELPDLQARLAEDEAMIRKAIEELLRFRGLVNSPRVVRRDGEFMGGTIRRGEQVHICNATSGLDPKANRCPLEFDLTRDRPRHSAFGGGPHHCAGAPLARMELNVFFTEWFRRIPSFELTGKPVKFTPGIINAIDGVHLRW